MSEPCGQKFPQLLIITSGAVSRDLAAGSGDAISAKQFVMRPNSIPEEVDAAVDRRDMPFREPKAQLVAGESLDTFLDLTKMLGTVSEHDEIIHVTEPDIFTQRLLQVPVQRGARIDVGKNLRSETS